MGTTLIHLHHEAPMSLFEDFNAQQPDGEEYSAPFVFIASMTYMAAADGVVLDEELMPILAWMGSEPDAVEAAQKAMRFARETPVEDFLDSVAPLLNRDQKLCLLANLLDVLFADGFADPGFDLVGSDLFPQHLLCPGVLPFGRTREWSCAGVVSFWGESFIHNYILYKILWIFRGRNCG